MTESEKVYESYKPLRNHLRKVELLDSLEVIWHYYRYLNDKTKLPPHITPPPIFEQARLGNDALERYLTRWELDTITREVIVNADRISNGKSLREANYFAFTINKLKDLDNGICGAYVDDKNIMVEVGVRLTHRQFPWQIVPNKIDMYRYYRIFSYDGLSKTIEAKYGISYEQLFFVGFAFWSIFINNYSAKDKLEVIDLPITDSDIAKFLSIFSITLDDLKQKIVDNQSFTDKFVYTFNPLHAYPIIHIGSFLYCPITTLLSWRITSGIYYELLGEKDFDNNFGDSFQKYIGEVIGRADLAQKYEVIAESEYTVGKNRKDTIDWIVTDKKAALFAECKTKRLTYAAKESLDRAEVNKQLDIIADGVLQMYSTILDYQGGNYSTLKYSKELIIYPVLVTLESWYILDSRALEEIVSKKAKSVGIPESMIKDMPYSVVSCRDFENLMQVIDKVGIQNVMSSKLQDKYSHWDFFPFLRDCFKDEYSKSQFLFEKEFEEIFNMNKEGK